MLIRELGMLQLVLAYWSDGQEGSQSRAWDIFFLWSYKQSPRNFVKEEWNVFLNRHSELFLYISISSGHCKISEDSNFWMCQPRYLHSEPPSPCKSGPQSLHNRLLRWRIQPSLITCYSFNRPDLNWFLFIGCMRLVSWIDADSFLDPCPITTTLLLHPQNFSNTWDTAPASTLSFPNTPPFLPWLKYFIIATTAACQRDYPYSTYTSDGVIIVNCGVVDPAQSPLLEPDSSWHHLP